MTGPTQAGGKHIVRKIMVDLAIMTVIGVILALIGPFGSFELPLAVRLVSWVVFAWIGYAIYSPVSLLVSRLHAWLELPTAGLWLAGAMLATFPMTAVVWIMNHIGGPVPWPSLERFFELYLYVFVIGGGITGFFVLTDRDGSNPAPVPDTAPSPGAQEVPRFLDRLPPQLGTQLLALEMEDHYVRAHTALGSELVLMRLGDAIAELTAIDGMQVHRSWWVARDAVEDVRREDRNLRLLLSNGIEAPVSRNRANDLRDAGWL